MRFKDFEDVLSADRMRRYVKACGGNVQKGMTLYRYNLILSSEMLKIISCFEVALRNRIDRTLEPHFGNDWLRDSCLPGGIFDNPRTLGTQKIIGKAYQGLIATSSYTPTKLMAEMEFGLSTLTISTFSMNLIASIRFATESLIMSRFVSRQGCRLSRWYMFNRNTLVF